MTELCKRLREIYLQLPVCDTVIDIGSDHGILPCHLLKDNRVKRAVITDISEKSLKKARRLATEQGLLDSVVFHCGDGFKELKEKADAAVVAGMGGKEIAEILLYMPYNVPVLVLQPMKDASFLREFLCEKGYTIAVDKIVCLRGRYYVIIKAEAGGQNTLTPDEIRFGKTNLQDKSADFYNYLIKQRNRLSRIAEKNDTVISDLQAVNRALKGYEKSTDGNT